jgi:hypothetical protein
MQKRVIDLRTERPLLDIASLGRRGRDAKLTPNELASIARTARRAPEVMIKVSGGARTLHGVGAHFDYIGREGLNEIETDMGERLMERGFEDELLLDWDLDLGVRRRHTDRAIADGRKPLKLVHNLIFSMPKGTPADKLEAAVRAFAVDRFALHWSGCRLRHSYARQCCARRIERSRPNRFQHFHRRNHDDSSRHSASRLRRIRRCAAQ